MPTYDVLIGGRPVGRATAATQEDAIGAALEAITVEEAKAITIAHAAVEVDNTGLIHYQIPDKLIRPSWRPGQKLVATINSPGDVVRSISDKPDLKPGEYEEHAIDFGHYRIGVVFNPGILSYGTVRADLARKSPRKTAFSR